MNSINDNVGSTAYNRDQHDNIDQQIVQIESAEELIYDSRIVTSRFR